jgi:hypothetical protein
MKITACNEDFREAAEWYAGALGIADRDFTLDVDYEDPAEMPGSAYLDFLGGEAVIRISTSLCETEDEMELLAHEMVHLKQYVTGQLIDFAGIVIWEGTAHDVSNDGFSWAYWNSPWELEAFGRQQGLNVMRCHARKENRYERS